MDKREFIAVVLMCLLYFAIASLMPARQLPPLGNTGTCTRYVSPYSPTEKQWINKRFRYHGIWTCSVEKGKYYFYRDGKRCAFK